MESKQKKIRLDQLLVQRGLIENPSKAKARIMAGDVIVNDHRIDKAGEKFSVDAVIRLKGNSHPFVSRGGIKLQHALKIWPSKIEDSVCLDVGASTGGFTDVLLKSGAKLVYAVDVGYGQLAQRLRQNCKVINMERTHILHLEEKDLDLKPSIAVIDVSFISVKKILQHVLRLLDDNALLFVLIKPQFEAGRDQVQKGGIIKDSAVHREVVENMIEYCQGLGLQVLGVEKSPVLGAKGNAEFLMALRMGERFNVVQADLLSSELLI